MNRFATTIRSTFVTALTVVLVAAGAASFAAYEAKVVQVKAVVENAVVLDVSSMDFGNTIYPRVATGTPLTISLANSFVADDGVDGVSYVIKPKPKVKYPCGVPGYGYGTSTSSCPDPNKNPVPGDPWAEITVGDFSGYAWDYCESRMPQDASTTDDIFYTVDLGNDYWKYCYLPMASWMGLHKEQSETALSSTTLPNIVTDFSYPDQYNGMSGMDREVWAFHQPYPYFWDYSGTSTLASSSVAMGALSKSFGDTSDTWNTYLLSPCFSGFCPGSADELSYSGYWIPELATASSFTYGVPVTSRLDPQTEHSVYGTDLWIEVTGFSYGMPSTTASTTASSTIRYGQLVHTGGSVDLVGINGLIRIPNSTVFSSWCFNYADVLPVTPAESMLPFFGALSERYSMQTNPYDGSPIGVPSCAGQP